MRTFNIGGYMKMNSVDCDVAVIGAGPYGLSAAAHLREVGVDTKIFGKPMEFWATGMPDGMLLRSPREASTISDPHSAFTLEAYEKSTGTPPAKRVKWHTFVNYGRWFQQQIGCELDQRQVVNVNRENSGFRISLADNSTYKAHRVLVAAGIGPFRKAPAVFAQLSPLRASHCYEGRKLCEMGKRVAVIGAGQSALESAALLHEAGIEVEVIARIPELRWIGMHKRLHQLGVISKLLYSKHDVGPIGISRLVAYPNLMYYLPMGPKDRVRKRAIRSAGAPWLIPRLDGVKISTGRSVRSAKEISGEVQLILDDSSERRVDHVLMGTGYHVNISSYGFLSPELVSQIQQLDGYPDVSAGLTTSVPGLHFTGATASRNFGPLMYFVTGTEFASKELASWIRSHHNGNGAH
jgi:thioredoxin reductase